MNQKALSSIPTNVGVRQTPIMSIKGTPILSREKMRGIPTIYGCRTSRTCGYWGTCCTCILSPTPIRTPYWAGAYPTVSAPRIRQRPCAWRSGSPEAATFAVPYTTRTGGSQYASEAYVSCLMEHHIRISMTEGYEPTDNAMAERQNGIFKVEWIYEQEMYRDKEQAINEINRMIDFYNNRRPHMSIGMECPMEVYKGKLPGKNLWRKRP